MIIGWEHLASGESGMFMPATSRRRFRASRLVELLVVISIIALLVALLLPALANARQRADMTKDLRLQRQVFLALSAYATDQHEYPCLESPL